MKQSFLMITSNHYDENGNSVVSDDVLDRRIAEASWPIYEKTRNRTRFEPGSRLFFYVSQSKGGGVIKGQASILSIDPPTRNSFDENELATVCSIIRFHQVVLYSKPVRFLDQLPKLSFCPRNMQKWGVIVMGGCRRLTVEDAEIIQNASKQ